MSSRRDRSASMSAAAARRGVLREAEGVQHPEDTLREHLPLPFREGELPFGAVVGGVQPEQAARRSMRRRTVSIAFRFP